MPGAPMKGHVLHHLAIAPDQQMGRDAQRVDFAEIGMGRRIQRVGEQAIDVVTAELARWQADAVDDQQTDLRPVRSGVLIGRGHLPRANQQTPFTVDPQIHGASRGPAASAAAMAACSFGSRASLCSSAWYSPSTYRCSEGK